MKDPGGHQRVRYLELVAEPADQQRHHGGELDAARKVQDPAEPPRRCGLVRGPVSGRLDHPGKPDHDRDHPAERSRVNQEHPPCPGCLDQEPGQRRASDLGYAGQHAADRGSTPELISADQVQQEDLASWQSQGLRAADTAAQQA